MADTTDTTETALEEPVEQSQPTEGTVPTSAGPTVALNPPSTADVLGGYNEAAAGALTQETTSYSGYTAPTDKIDALAANSGSTYNTPETTVAGNLRDLLDSGSALSNQAKMEGRVAATASGMESSASAIGNIRRRQIEALLPVAQQDADTAKQFKLAQQKQDDAVKTIQVEAEVSGALNQQKAQITEQQTRINQNWDAVMKGMDTAAQAALTDFKYQKETELKEIEASISRELQKQQIDAEVEQTILVKGQEAMNNYQITIQQLMANDAFLDNFSGKQEAMYQMFDDLFKTVTSGMILTAKSAGVYYDEETGTGLKPYIEELAAANQWLPV